MTLLHGDRGKQLLKGLHIADVSCNPLPGLIVRGGRYPQGGRSATASPSAHPGVSSVQPLPGLCAGAMYSAPTEGCGVRADAPHCVYGCMVARATAEPLNLPKPHDYSWGLHPIHIRSTVERLHLSRCQMQPFQGCYFMLCRNPTNNRGALVDNTVPRYYWDRAGEFMWD